jgi:hypothetical protein
MVRADDAVALWTRAGLTLDPWQEALLRQSLECDGEQWRHFEVACICPRQNGKGSFLEARELAGLYLDDECDLIVHSAHEFSTSLEAFRRLLALIEDTPDLRRQVKRVSRSHGEEGIELDDGSRIRFKTRTKAGGRGLSSDLLILDEAMILPEHALAALLPTLSARPNPQVIYTGSAVDQAIHEHGVVLARVRERGQAGSVDLAYREYACQTRLEALLTDPELLDDRDRWAEANPALGTRIAAGHVAHERASLSVNLAPRLEFSQSKFRMAISGTYAGAIGNVLTLFATDNGTTFATFKYVLATTEEAFSFSVDYATTAGSHVMRWDASATASSVLRVTGAKPLSAVVEEIIRTNASNDP